MSIATSQVGWARYRDWEGPMFLGTKAGKYKLPANPDNLDKILAVTTAIESGNYMATQGYDRGVMSTGLIQFIEAGQYSVSAMLGAVMEELGHGGIGPVVNYYASLNMGISFHKDLRGRYRFHINGNVVDTEYELNTLFRLRSNGRVGTWDDRSREHGKGWVAAIASVWAAPEAQAIQNAYTTDRLFRFCLPYARDFINMTPPSAEGEAFKALYISFAVNNPSIANKYLEKANKEARDRGIDYWSEDWLICVAKSLTLGPGISIYPHRYDAARPVLERLYGVKLPDFTDDLKAWRSDSSFERFFTTTEIQEALIKLGFDLGPTGADGKFGPKTRGALLAFERQAGVPSAQQDGMPDKYTAKALQAALSRGYVKSS